MQSNFIILPTLGLTYLLLGFLWRVSVHPIISSILQ